MSTFNKNTIISGLGWTTVSTIANGLAQILRLTILSRFLSKEDFGIVAILTFILGLTQVFSDMGFSAAIMSQKKISRSDFLSLYWLQFCVFIAMMFSVSVCSPLIANYYDSPSFFTNYFFFLYGFIVHFLYFFCYKISARK